MRVAIIPARGGSKRIPRKNIRVFCGQPMLAWSVAAALETGLFDSVVVSTDDEEIAAVARSCGAEVPFFRPAHLSDDRAPTRDVIRHAITELAAAGGDPTEVCCIYATAPFVRAADIRRGLDLMLNSDAAFVFSVTTFAYPIQRALKLDAGRLEMFWPEHRWARSQDLEEAYHDAGQFYWGRASAYLGEEDAFAGTAVPVVLPRYRVQDIDTEEDWRRAELMFRTLADPEWAGAS